jgi:queuine tRNA-ribosyltransferase subunit QTRTD1
MADEVPCSVKPARLKTAVERTDGWAGECLALAASAGVAALPLVSIAGGASVELRERSARAAAARPGAAGFALTGFGTGESPEEADAALRAAVGPLPPGLPRLMCGLAGGPQRLLDAVVGGADLFDDAYVVRCSEMGYALTFAIAPPTAGADGGGSGVDAAGAAGDGHKLHLRADACAEDTRPLLPGCGCYACARHTRAYLHHLLGVHEMLADVLLELHNSYHYGRFAGVRALSRARRTLRRRPLCLLPLSSHRWALFPLPRRRRFGRLSRRGGSRPTAPGSRPPTTSARRQPRRWRRSRSGRTRYERESSVGCNCR